MKNPQPIRRVLTAQGYGVTAFIDATGIRPSSHVQSAINGRAYPSQELRRIAVELLGVPLEELWEPDALAHEWSGPRGRHVRRFEEVTQ